jgi:hypothetical protein
MKENIINLDEKRKERFKNNIISAPSLMAFVPGECYIYPKLGIAIHVLFITDKSLHYSEAPIYVMEDQLGNIFAEILDDNSCDGWHLLQKDVFLKMVEDGQPPPPATA